MDKKSIAEKSYTNSVKTNKSLKDQITYSRGD